MITPKLLRDWGACWPDASIAIKFAGRTEVSPREISSDETVSLDDRLWLLCKALWYLDESAARGFAIESAMLVSHLAGDEDDQALHAAFCASLLEIEDLPEDQRDAAWAAARAAAWDAAAAAAWAAARAAAWDAAAAEAAARAEWVRKSIARALEWLGDYADGWEES